MMQLYSYFRSSGAYRTRIALQLKDVEHEIIPIHLLKGGGEQHTDDYRKINPHGLVPSLIDNKIIFTQSLAIFEYLEETIPEPSLLPNNSVDRAWVRAFALSIIADTHPVTNLRVLQTLTRDYHFNEQQKLDWIGHWFSKTLTALETQLNHDGKSGHYCYQNQITLADIALVPLIYNALRFELDLHPYPNITRIYQQCMSQSAFVLASPEAQPDAYQD